MLDKEFALELIKLLSAIESWSLSVKTPFPDHLHEYITEAVEQLSKEVLK